MERTMNNNLRFCIMMLLVMASVLVGVCQVPKTGFSAQATSLNFYFNDDPSVYAYTGQTRVVSATVQISIVVDGTFIPGVHTHPSWTVTISGPDPNNSQQTTTVGSATFTHPGPYTKANVSVTLPAAADAYSYTASLTGGEGEATPAFDNAKIIGVNSLSPNAGSEVDDGDNNANTKTYVVPAGAGGDITVTATPTPAATNEELQVAGWSLTGGTGSGLTTRTISRTAPGKYDFTCSCGTSEKRLTVLVTDVTFPRNSYFVAKGKQQALGATVNPAAAAAYVTFDTAHAAVATVSGTTTHLTVNGVAGGTTTLRAQIAGQQCGSTDITVVEVAFGTNPLYVTKDHSKSMAVTVTPNDPGLLAQITFDTDNPRIATVSGSSPSLTITGVGGGTALVRAKWNGETLAQSTVLVVAVSFTPNPLYVAKGQTETLTPVVTPALAANLVTFDTTETTIATLTGNAQGLTVTGVGAGETTARALLDGIVCGTSTIASVEATFDPSPIYVAKGHSTTVAVTVTPISAKSHVSYETVAAATATVQGTAPTVTVSGIATGSTTLRALLNTKPCGTATVTTLDLTFSPNPVPVGIGLTAPWTVTVTPDSAEEQVTFATAETSIATISGSAPSPTITGVAVGETEGQALLNGVVCWSGTITVFRPNIAMDGVDEASEENPGGFIATRNAPVAVTLALADNLARGTVTLSATGGQRIRLWTDAIKTTEIELPYAWTLGEDTPPTIVYVEGIQGSVALRDTGLTWSYTTDAGSISDMLALTVVYVNVQMQNLGEETGTTPHEELPGALMWLNRDDDNQNDTPDKDDTGTVANENDLVALSLSIAPNTLNVGSLTLGIGSQGKAWTTATKGTAAATTWALATDTLPTTLYLEGVTASSTLSDLEITTTYTQDSLTTSDLVKATVVDADLGLTGVTELQEETVGGFIGIHKAPLPVSIGIPSGLHVGTVTLEAVSGGSRIAIWNEAGKTTSLTLPATWDLSQQGVTLPAMVYVDGEQASQAVRDVTLRLSYTNGGITVSDQVKLTVIAVNIQAQNLGEETGNPPNEEDPGAFFWLNRDDDDQNGIPDKDDTGTVANENDLVAATLSLQPALTEGTVTLTVGSAGKAWTAATKGTAATTSWNLATDTLSGTIYLEGVTRSEALGDLDITLAFDNLTHVEDVLKATVAEANLIIPDVSEADEETIGGFVGKGQSPLAVQLGVPTNLGTGVVTLEAISGGTRIRVWADAAKTTEISLPATWDLDETGVTHPAIVYVEGIQTSATVRDVTLKLSYGKTGITVADQVKLTVIELNLQVQGLGEETGNTPHEEDPGAFFWLNRDDDDQNGIPDKDDTGTVTNENDLLAATLSLQPTLTEGTVTLQVGNQGKAWTTATKGTLATTSWDLATDTLANTIYLEGVSQSAALGDLEITLAFDHLTHVEDVVKATVVDVNLTIDDVSEADEETVGGFVGTGKELVPLTLAVPTNLRIGSVTLAAMAGATRIKVWADEAKTSEIVLPKTWDITQVGVSIPQTLYVEGVETSTAMRDVTLSLAYTKDGITVADTVKLTVVTLNLIVQNLAEESGATPHEEDPGAFLPLNGDDDNGNGILDKDDTTQVTGENELLPATIQGLTTGLNVGTVTLTSTEGVAVWLDATKTTSVPTSWDLANASVPTTVYLEGVMGSFAPGDQTLTLTYTQGDRVIIDEVTATVVTVDITVAGVAEEVEETQGAYLGVNNNDDNGNGIADKDETPDPVSGETFVEREINLQPVTLALSPMLTTGTITLSTANASVKVWTSPKKVTEITLPRVWDIEDAETDSLPTTIYVEGISPSTLLRDAGLTLTYAGYGMSASDTAKITVVQVDVSMQNLTEANEESTGAFLMLNRDDDNDNEIADKDETTTVTGENDLVAVTLTLTPATLDTGTLDLTLGSMMKAWTTSTKGTVGTTTWSLSPTAPFAQTTYYLEGTEASRALRDGEVKLSYKNGTAPLHTDIVKVTVANLTVSMADRVLYPNTDDDNYSATDGPPPTDGSDLNEIGPITDENDLREVQIKLEPAGLPGTLTVVAQTLHEEPNPPTEARVTLWLDARKATAAPTGLTWTLNGSEATPTALWLEGKELSSAPDDQRIAVNYACEGVSLSAEVLATVNARSGDSEVSFKLFATSMEDPTVATLLTELDGTIGGTVAVVMEVKVGPGNRMARDANAALLANEVTVRVKDEWSGYEVGKTCAFTDSDVQLDWASAWSELVNAGTAQSGWVAGETSPTVNNSAGSKRRVFRHVVQVWDTQKGPSVEYNVAVAGQPEVWRGFDSSMGHNGKHSIAVAAIDGDANKQTIAFQAYDVFADGWSDPVEGGPSPSEVDVKNLVVNTISATHGNIDYFKYDPDPGSPYNRPVVRFTIEDKNQPGQEGHYYRYWVMVQPTRASGKEFLDLGDVYGYAYAYVSGDAPPLIKEVEWKGKVNIWNEGHTNYWTSEEDEADWGTYTYDVIVNEFDANNKCVDTFAYKWPYCLTLGDHNLYYQDIESGADLKCNYQYRDYSLENTGSAVIDNEVAPAGLEYHLLDVFELVSSNNNAINTCFDNNDISLKQCEPNDCALRIVFLGEDNCWIAYNRTHSAIRMLAVNQVINSVTVNDYNYCINKYIGSIFTQDTFTSYFNEKKDVVQAAASGTADYSYRLASSALFSVGDGISNLIMLTFGGSTGDPHLVNGYFQYNYYNPNEEFIKGILSLPKVIPYQLTFYKRLDDPEATGESIVFWASIAAGGKAVAGKLRATRLTTGETVVEFVESGKTTWTELPDGAKILNRSFTGYKYIDVVAQYIERVKRIATELPENDRDVGNIGIADMTIKDGTSVGIKAFSHYTNEADAAAHGFVTFTGNPSFPAKVVEYLRIHDAEYKLLNHIDAEILKGNTASKGTITLFTEKAPCKSCADVIDAFQRKYPGVDLRVVSANTGKSNLREYGVLAPKKD